MPRARKDVHPAWSTRAAAKTPLLPLTLGTSTSTTTCTSDLVKRTYTGTLAELCGRSPQYAPAPCKLTFDLESGVQVSCEVGYLCANFSLPRPLCSRLRPDVCERQMSDAHHRLKPPYPRGECIMINGNGGCRMVTRASDSPTTYDALQMCID